MSSEPHDVFLSHNHADKTLVHQLYEALTQRGLRVWLDEREVSPGTLWLPALEQAARTARSAVIAIGAGGLVRWAEAERQVLEDESVARGIPIVPALLAGAPEGGDLPGFLRRHQWVDLRQGFDEATVDRLVAALRQAPASAVAPPDSPRRPLYRLYYDVPPLPGEYQDRREREELKRKLLARDDRPVSVLGLHGMGGVGKTVLAAALANDPDVVRSFPHGVFWFTLGRETSPERLKGLQEQWIEELSGVRSVPADLEQGKDRLRALLRERACLLVLDDVWDAEPAEALAVLGRMGKLLLTTRNERVARRLGAEPDPIGELPPAEGLSLLARYAGSARDALPPEAREVAGECGYLPLALAMAGSMVRGRPPDRWRNVLQRFRRADLDAIEALFPGTPHRTLLRAIEVSVQALPEATAARYLDLAVFPEDSAIPEAALGAYFAPAGLGGEAVQDLVDDIVDASLARRDGEGRIRLHDLQHDYVRRRAGDLTPLHERLLAGYRRAAGGGWHTGPDDGYLYQHLAHHLAAAGRRPELRALLLHPGWLTARLRAHGAQDLLGDFGELGVTEDPPLRLLRDALRLSSHVLTGQPEQLAAQLLGRLGGFEDSELSRLLSQVDVPPAGLWPLWPALNTPGGPLVRVVPNQEHSVSAVALTPDGRTAISGQRYTTAVKVWDLDRGALRWSLEAHREDVWALAITADGRMGLSAARDGALCVWDLERGALLHELEKHEGLVRSVAMTPDGRLAVSGGEDGVLKLWDVREARLRASVSGEPIWQVALSADGALLLCCSEKGRVTTFAAGAEDLRALCSFDAGSTKVWMAPDGSRVVVLSHEEIRELDSRSGALRWSRQNPGRSFGFREWRRENLAVTGPGYVVLTRSPGDRVVEIWDVGAVRPLNTLEGHRGEVRAIDITPDGRTAVTGGLDADLMVWDLGAPIPARTGQHHEEWVDALLILPGPRALSLSKDRMMEWDLASGRRLASRETMIAWSTVVPVKDGRLAASVRSSDSSISLWDLEMCENAGTLHGHEGVVSALAGTPDGRWLVSGAVDCTLKLWDLQARAELRDFTGHQEILRSVAITPDGRWIASGDRNGRVNVFRAEESGPLRSFHSQGGEGVSAIALTPEGRLVACVSSDGFVDLWDIESGHHLGFRESRERNTRRELALGSDGQRVFVSCLQVLTAWEVSTGRSARFVGDNGFTCLAATLEGGVVAGDALGRVHHLAFEPR
jgi:WD40 repeat protein